MSTYSLNRLLNGGGHSRNEKVNQKFATMSRVEHPKTSSSDQNNNRRPLRRRGSVGRRFLERKGIRQTNPFRGIKKEELEKQASLYIHSMTVEELYEEILYQTLHNVGYEEESLGDDVLFHYTQEAFKISEERHMEILDVARNKEAPEIRLNVEIIEAKDLQSKDPNGLSDPFVALYIESDSSHRYNTSVKSETLAPVWEEYFSLPISDDPNSENLIVEVWDFDPAETLKEKMNKLFDVKGVRGFKRLMKEVAVAASMGKHDNELIGKTNIPLKTIPASGIVQWHSLEKKNKPKRQGLIKIRLNFSSEKNSQVAIQEHRYLLKILLLHELETSRVAAGWWAGKFSSEGEAILTQHSAQSGLTQNDLALAQYTVFAEIHAAHHALAFALFDSLLDKVIRPIQAKTVSPDEIKLFWESTKKLLPSCFNAIRNIRKQTSGEKSSVKNLNDVLNIISKVAMVEPPEGTDLFPSNIYGWIRTPQSEANWNIRETMTDAVNVGAENWFTHILEHQERTDDSDEAKLQKLIKIIQLVRSDLQRAVEHYDKVFQELMHFQYARELYGIYEGKVAEIVEPDVLEVVKNLKRIRLPDGSEQTGVHVEEINMGTTLFELYLVLKRFVTLGSALVPGETKFKINNYYKWFSTGVTHWLDISVYKALTRIEKAIELDKLTPVDDSVKYSSSAVDTLAIFYQIKTFWQQLGWPDAEGAYMFVGKIVDDICRCCAYYADTMARRVDGLGVVESPYGKKFEVTREWCLAINNIDYIRQSLTPFVKELGLDEIISRLADYNSPLEAERCAETLKNVTDNAIDTQKNKILELIEIVAKKMNPHMRKFLVEGAEVLHEDSNSMDRLMLYLENSLQTLHSELNEVNFQRILEAIWREIAVILYDLVQSNLDKRRPPCFFAALRQTLNLMIANFKSTQPYDERNSMEKEILEQVQSLLDLHAYETPDLIHQYYKERLKEQNELTTADYGELTIQAYFKENILELEIMNARNLVPMDSNGSCDPYVRVSFFPDVKFDSVTRPKTNTHSKTLFPLFDEKFTITLTSEQRAINDAIIVFTVKDHDYFAVSNQYIAESYLSFADIADITGDSGKIQQIHMKLNRPKLRTDSECLRALELRQGDKHAREFVKKLKQKMNGNA